MSEKIPPDPVSVPPTPPPTGPEADARAWGADGKSPVEAMGSVSKQSLSEDAAAVGRGIKGMFEPRPKAPTLDRYRYVAPKNLDAEDLSPTGPRVPEDFSQMPPVVKGKDYGGYRATDFEREVPKQPEEAIVETAPEPATPEEVVETADADTLKKALAEQMLKPAEMKKHYQTILKNSIERLEKRARVEKPGAEKITYRMTMETIARQAAIEKNKGLLSAEQAYENAQKNFYKKNNILGRVTKRVGSSIGLKSKELQEMERTRAARDTARLDAKAEFEKAARERWAAEGRSPEWMERALQKYENLYLFRGIIDPAANTNIQIRAEALGEKAPDALEKGVRWIRRQDEKVTNLFATGLEKMGVDPETAARRAKYVRAISSAILVGGAAFVGSMGTAGILAAAGYGGYTALRKIGAFALGASSAEVAGATYRKFIGEKAQAKAITSEAELREEMRRLSQSKELTLEIMQALDRKRQQLQERASDDTLEQKTLAVRTLVGLGVGVGAAVALAEHQDTGEVIRAGEVAERAGVTETPAAPSAEDVRAPSAGSSIDSTPTTPEAAPVPVPEEARSLSIAGGINNADRLVGHFGLQLSEAYPNLADAPPSVQNFIELLRTEEGASLLAGEDKATLALGLQEENGTSAIMQPGDVIRLNEANQIVLERPGTELSAVLVEADGTVATTHGFPMESAPAAADVPQQPEQPAQPAPAAPVEAPTQPQVPEQPPVEPPPAPPVAAEVPVAPTPPVVEAAPTPAPEVPVQPEYTPVEPPAPPEPPPAPEAPAAPEVPPAAPPTPEAPPAPESTIDYTQPYTNINGVDIDPRQPAIFIDSRGDVVAYGGSTLERTAFAQQYAIEHPGVRVLYDATTESIYGIPQPILGAMVADTNGLVTPYSGLLQPDYFRGLSIPHPNDLIRTVPFTPTPRP